MKQSTRDNNISFGQRLKTLRIDRRFSQVELADKAKIHNTHISRYEKDAAKPATDTLMRLADALGVTADYLMEGTTDQVAQDRLSDVELLRQFQEVELLPEDKKQHIKFLIQSVVQNHNVEAALAG